MRDCKGDLLFVGELHDVKRTIKKNSNFLHHLIDITRYEIPPGKRMSKVMESSIYSDCSAAFLKHFGIFFGEIL